MDYVIFYYVIGGGLLCNKSRKENFRLNKDLRSILNFVNLNYSAKSVKSVVQILLCNLRVNHIQIIIGFAIFIKNTFPGTYRLPYK